MRRALVRRVVTCFTLWFASGCATSEKYAVLISAEQAVTSNYVKGQSPFWDDLLLMYRMLLENGFDPDNIFVLYGTGHDLARGQPDCTASWCPERNIVDLPLARYVPANGSCEFDDPFCAFEIACSEKENCSVYFALWCLRTGCNEQDVHQDFGCGYANLRCSVRRIPKLTKKDFLFVWWKGHGRSVSLPRESSEGSPIRTRSSCNCGSESFVPGPPGCEYSGLDPHKTKCKSDLKLGNSWLETETLAGWLRLIPSERQLIAIDACRPGGAVRALDEHCQVTMVSAACDQKGNDDLWSSALAQAMFPVDHRRALLGEPFPSDLDCNYDGSISCLESFLRSIEGMKETTDQGTSNLQEPQMGDPDKIAPCLDLKHPKIHSTPPSGTR